MGFDFGSRRHDKESGGTSERLKLMEADEEKKTGFAGIAGLASKISRFNPIAGASTKGGNEDSHQELETAASEARWKGSGSGANDTYVCASNGSEPGFWILMILVLVGLGAIANDLLTDNRKPAEKVTSSVQSEGDRPFGVVDTAPSTGALNRNTGPKYQKPSVGNERLLSAAEIRWCVRESIRLDAMRDVVNTNEAIETFNQVVSDFNIRCGRYRYQSADRELAEHDVGIVRGEIVTAAIAESVQMGRPSRPSNRVLILGPGEGSDLNRPGVIDIIEAQSLLTKLGYDPGPVDGEYGQRTVDAVKAFQHDAAIIQDGLVDEHLLSVLRLAWNEMELRQ